MTQEEEFVRLKAVIDDARDHQAIKEVQALIVPQLQKQLADTTKKK